MGLDECEKFVGPMPVDVFLSEFVPEAPSQRPADGLTFRYSSISGNEDEFIRAIEASTLCPDLTFTNTTSQAGEPDHKPAIAVHSRAYLDDAETSSGSPALPDWRDIQLWIVTRGNDDDFFRSLEEADPEGRVRWTKSTFETCRQLITCSACANIYQFRVFSFSVAFSGDTARLLRWDRCGVIYTDSFKWASDPCTLIEFLWRFNFLSDVDRGYDTTVTTVEDDEAEVALPKLRTYRGLENVTRDELRKFLVRSDFASDQQTRWYIAPREICDHDFLFGHSTYGFIAYDVTTARLVYLKDFWRVDLPGITKEGDVYRELRDAQVPNIARFGRAGDVPLTTEGADVLPFAVQRTKTQEYVMGNGGEQTPCYGTLGFVPYIHYRLVLETLGRPLKTYKSTRQLCEVIRDAIVAHAAAYERTQILHRDISSGNILITEEGSGILIDWELSKKVKKDVDVTRKSKQHSRVGTWQFISIARLVDPSIRPHDVSDDMESFFWVLLYQIAKYRKTELDFSSDIKRVFYQYPGSDSVHSDDYHVGGSKGKMLCLKNYELDPVVIERLVGTPCRNIIEDLRTLFRDFYGYRPPVPYLCQRARGEASKAQNPLVLAAREKLRSSEWILGVINGHLAAEWNVDDDGSLRNVTHPPDPVPPADENPRKRKASGGNEGETVASSKKQKKSQASHSSESNNSEEPKADPPRRVPFASYGSDETVHSTPGDRIPRIGQARFAMRQ